ncbi:MAG: DsbC family protein [Pseudomonadota bacterium]
MKSLLVLALTFASTCFAVNAQDSNPTALTKEQVKAKISAAFPRASVERIEDGPIEGFYQVVSQGEVYYASVDGKHMLFGNLISIENGIKNLTQETLAKIEAEKAPMRAADIKSLKNNDFVVFKAENEKHKVTVFTDVDCGYCRKLHKEVKELNNLGVTVQYLAFPRAGIPSDSYNKLMAVWCSDNRTAAMDNAKLNRKFDFKTCENTIQDKHMPLVRKFNLRGTPAIVTEGGDIIAGYLPPQQLLTRLESIDANKVSKVN